MKNGSFINFIVLWSLPLFLQGAAISAVPTDSGSITNPAADSAIGTSLPQDSPYRSTTVENNLENDTKTGHLPILPDTTLSDSSTTNTASQEPTRSITSPSIPTPTQSATINDNSFSSKTAQNSRSELLPSPAAIVQKKETTPQQSTPEKPDSLPVQTVKKQAPKTAVSITPAKPSVQKERALHNYKTPAPPPPALTKADVSDTTIVVDQHSLLIKDSSVNDSNSTTPGTVSPPSQKKKFSPFSFLKKIKPQSGIPTTIPSAAPDKTAAPKKTLPDNNVVTTDTTSVVAKITDTTTTSGSALLSKSLKRLIPRSKEASPVSVKKEWRFFKTGKLVSAFIIFLIGWTALHYSTLLMTLLSERWPQYRLIIKGFIPVVRIVGWTLVIGFIIVGIFKPPIESVLAFTASAGIAIGFASQDILKNIFGGIVILFDKPFKVGDKIQLDTFYGEVISIGIRTVRIVTMDDSVIAIPNSEIVSKSVSNANSGEPDCQVAAEFYFETDLDLDKAFTLAQQCAAISRYIYLNKPIAVVFKNEIHLGKNMIHMRLKAYVTDHRFEMPFITDMSRTVFREFRKAGLIPAPVPPLQPLPKGA